MTGELPYDHEDRRSIEDQLREQAQQEALERDGFSVVEKAFEIKARVDQGQAQLTEKDLEWVRSLNPKTYPKFRAALLPSQVAVMDQAALEAMDCGYVM